MSTGKLGGLLNLPRTTKLEYLPVEIKLSEHEVHDLHIILWHFINQTIQYQKYLMNATNNADLSESDQDILIAERLMKRITTHDFADGT